MRRSGPWRSRASKGSDGPRPWGEGGRELAGVAIITVVRRGRNRERRGVRQILDGRLTMDERSRIIARHPTKPRLSATRTELLENVAAKWRARSLSAGPDVAWSPGEHEWVCRSEINFVVHAVDPRWQANGQIRQGQPRERVADRIQTLADHA